MSTDNTNTSQPAMLPGDANNLRVEIGEDGKPTSVEFLDVADAQQLSHSADVQQYPSAAEFNAEIESHNKAISDLRAKLEEKTFDSRTGQVKGHSYEGEARLRLEAQLNTRKAALGYTTFNLSRAHQAAEARSAKSAQLAADNQPSDDTTSLVAQARRESLIAQTAADLGADNKPIGRIEATRLVDAELNRERVAARVRASR
jgi:hypothetical protein